MSRPGKIIEAQQRSETQKASGRLAGNLGNLSLGRQVIALALWPFLEQILSFMVNSVDLIIATRMSEGDARTDIMDALGFCGYVNWLIMILQGAVASGVLAIISRSAGARNATEARQSLAQGLLAGISIGILWGIIIRLNLNNLITLFGLNPEAGIHAHKYLSILCWSCPILGIFFAATNALRAIGDTRTPFFVMLLINIINAGLSLALVFLPHPIGGLGISGLAWGSLSAWILGTLIIIVILYRENDPKTDAITLTLRRADWRPHRPTLARITRVGIPNALEMLGMWSIHAYVIRYITSLPTKGSLGAHFIAIRVESLSFLPGFAIGTATATLVGQYLGAQNPDMALKALKKAWLFAVVFMSSIGLTFLIAPAFIARLILPETDDQATALLNLAIPLISICGIFQPFLATNIILKTSLRGAGATNTVMTYSFTSLILFRIIALTIYHQFTPLTLTTIWVFMSIDLICQSLIFTHISRKGEWLHTKV